VSLQEKTKENVVRRTAQDELKGANPQEINAVTKFFMDQPEIKSVGDIFKWFSWLLGKIWDSFLEWGAELLGIKQVGTKAVELAAGAVAMVLTGGASAAVARGNGRTAVLFGDSQMAGGIGKAWKDYVTNKGWQVCSGCKLGGGRHGTISGWVRSRELQKILEKEKPTLVVVALGGWAGNWDRSPELIEKIKKWSGNEKVKIIWSGAPPVVKGYSKYSKRLFDSRKKHNDTIKEKLKPHSDTVTFVDPYDYVLDFYTKAPPGDGLHMPESVAKKYVSKVTSGWERVTQRQKIHKVPQDKKNVAEIITEEALKADVDPFFAVTIARIESGLNPLSNKDNKKTQFKGLYQFGGRYKDEWAKHGLEWNKVYEARHAAAAFMSAIKTRARSLGISPRIINDAEGAKLYLSWQQGPCGVGAISKAADNNENVDPHACGRKTNLLYNMVNNIPYDRRKNYIDNVNGILHKGEKLFITPKQFLELWTEKYRRFNKSARLHYDRIIIKKSAELQKKKEAGSAAAAGVWTPPPPR